MGSRLRPKFEACTPIKSENHDLVEVHQIDPMAGLRVPRAWGAGLNLNSKPATPSSRQLRFGQIPLNRANGPFQGAQAFGSRPRHQFETGNPIGAENHVLVQFHQIDPMAGIGVPRSWGAGLDLNSKPATPSEPFRYLKICKGNTLLLM